MWTTSLMLALRRLSCGEDTDFFSDPVGFTTELVLDISWRFHEHPMVLSSVVVVACAGGLLAAGVALLRKEAS